MPAIDEQVVTKVVSEVLNRLRQQQSTVPPAPSVPSMANAPTAAAGSHGVYDDMNAACDAAQRSFDKLRAAGVTARKAAINVIRRLCVEKADEWGRLEFAETKIGRLEHKIEKLKICGDLVPGVEMLERMAFSGDFGLTVIDLSLIHI